MKFRVTVTKIEEKEVLKSIYVGEHEGSKSPYANKLVPEQVETTIFEQTVDELKLIEVIKATNGVT